MPWSSISKTPSEYFTRGLDFDTPVLKEIKDMSRGNLIKLVETLCSFRSSYPMSPIFQPKLKLLLEAGKVVYDAGMGSLAGSHLQSSGLVGENTAGEEIEFDAQSSTTAIKEYDSIKEQDHVEEHVDDMHDMHPGLKSFNLQSTSL